MLTSLTVITVAPGSQQSSAVGAVKDGTSGHSMVTLAPWPARTGGVRSTTVTVAVAVTVMRPSLTESVTGVEPSANGPAGVSVKVSGSPSGSLEPLLTMAAVTMPWQFTSSATTSTF